MCAAVAVVLGIALYVYLTVRRYAPRERSDRIIFRGDYKARAAHRFGLTREGGSLLGTLEDGRSVAVNFFRRQDDQVVSIRIGVTKAPTLEVKLEPGYFDRPRHVALDHYLVVDGTDPEKAKRVLERGAASRRAIVDALVRCHATLFKVEKDELHVEVPLSQLPETDDLARLVGHVIDAARALDRIALDVKVLGGERLALAGAHGRARCAYCHGDLMGDEPDLVACDRCGTVLHGGCWSELGHCPLLGCTGRDPERARAQG